MKYMLSYKGGKIAVYCTSSTYIHLRNQQQRCTSVSVIFFGSRNIRKPRAKWQLEFIFTFYVLYIFIYVSSNQRNVRCKNSLRITPATTSHSISLHRPSQCSRNFSKDFGIFLESFTPKKRGCSDDELIAKF